MYMKLQGYLTIYTLVVRVDDFITCKLLMASRNRA